MRCYTCFCIYDKELDFCRRCGYNTITRVSVSIGADGYKVHLKKNYNYKTREIRDKNGKAIKSEDQREYLLLKRERRRDEKNYKKLIEKDIFL
jgi:hypothetical protein